MKDERYEIYAEIIKNEDKKIGTEIAITKKKAILPKTKNQKNDKCNKRNRKIAKND